MTGRHFEADIDGTHVIQTETVVNHCLHCRVVCPMLCLMMGSALTDSINNPFVVQLQCLQKSIGLCSSRFAAFVSITSCAITVV
jgi:hypothetical protein